MDDKPLLKPSTGLAVFLIGTTLAVLFAVLLS